MRLYISMAWGYARTVLMWRIIVVVVVLLLLTAPPVKSAFTA